MTSATASIAAAVLAVGLFASPAYADDKNPTPAPSAAPNPSPAPTEEKKVFKQGTREWTEHCLLVAKKSYDEYKKVMCSGTDEEKKLAKQQYDYDLGYAMIAIEHEAETGKDIRHALDELYHYAAIYHRLEENPKSGASELAAAKKDFDKASNTWGELKKRNIKRIRAELGVDALFESQENCPAPSQTTPPEEKKEKKKKHKGDTSGPLDFFGDVTIGVGVGEHSDRRHKDTRRSHEKDKDEEKSDEQNGEPEHDNISHEPNDRESDKDRSHESGGHDDKDKKHDHHKDDAGDTSPAPH